MFEIGEESTWSVILVTLTLPIMNSLVGKCKSSYGSFPNTLASHFPPLHLFPPWIFKHSMALIKESTVEDIPQLLFSACVQSPIRSIH